MTRAHPSPSSPGAKPDSSSHRGQPGSSSHRGQPDSSSHRGQPGATAELSEVDLLMRLARRWRSLGMAEAGQHHEHGLSPHQERGLLALARLVRRSAHDTSMEDFGASPGVRVSHLADHLGIAPRSATEVADALESAGLLTRSSDPTDRRAVLLALTDEGRHTVGRVRDRRRAAADQAVASLSPTDRADLRRLLLTLLDGS